MNIFIPLKKRPMAKLQFFILIFLFAFISNSLQAQVPSKVKPTKVFWIADGDTISYTEATTKGISKPDSLILLLEFPPNILEKVNKKKNGIIFKWHRYGVMTPYLTDTRVRRFPILLKSNPMQKIKKLPLQIKSKKKDLMSGWLMVKARSMIDGKYIYFNNTSEFKIYIIN